MILKALLFTALVAMPLAAQRAAEPAAAQTTAGAGALDPTLPAGVTIAQIIEKMGQQESAFAAAREQYTFRQDVTFDTISDDSGQPDGEYRQITDISFDDAGRREEHVVFAPQNTVERVTMTENDFSDIEKRLPFILTAPELPEYDLTYLGRQRIDELDTYVFECKPKQLVKGHRYFQGEVWIDQEDDEIVLIDGISVPQDMRRGHEDLSPPFTTYYDRVDGKYWFPVYTKAEGTLRFPAREGALSQAVHVRAIVRYADYKRFHTKVTIHYNGEVLDNNSGARPQEPKPPQL